MSTKSKPVLEHSMTITFALTGHSHVLPGALLL